MTRTVLSIMLLAGSCYGQANTAVMRDSPEFNRMLGNMAAERGGIGVRSPEDNAKELKETLCLVLSSHQHYNAKQSTSRQRMCDEFLFLYKTVKVYEWHGTERDQVLTGQFLRITGTTVYFDVKGEEKKVQLIRLAPGDRAVVKLIDRNKRLLASTP